MSNQNKTLADVQPGGRVRLGDQGVRARFEAWAEERELDTAKCSADGMKGDYADLNTDWCWAAWQAALPAQPSPGGQDALDCIGRIEEAIEFRVPHDIYAAVHGELAELKAALAGRQPSKQPDSVALGEATEFCIEKGDRQPVGTAPQGCDACDQTGIRQNDEGRNICCPDCDLGRTCAGDTRQPVGEQGEGDDFLAGICVALQCVTAQDCGVLWREIVVAVGIDDLLQYATFIEPEEWELAGFGKYASAELRRRKPRIRASKQSKAPPAQAVDLGQMPHGIRLVEIPRRNGLDPINVFVQDYELGRGRIVVTCYGQAWCGFWGAMGDRTVMQFVAACDADYVAGNMLSGRHEHVKKHERTYVERIAIEVIAEFRALIDGKAVGNG